mgnify:CR=1 FL=1
MRQTGYELGKPQEAPMAFVLTLIIRVIANAVSDY